MKRAFMVIPGQTMPPEARKMAEVVRRAPKHKPRCIFCQLYVSRHSDTHTLIVIQPTHEQGVKLARYVRRLGLADGVVDKRGVRTCGGKSRSNA